MQSVALACQFAPPHSHRTNAAEKAIDTWKCHFLAALASVDPDFPIHLWCRLIYQATTTLNILRPSHINLRLSAKAQLNIAYDFNCSPLTPPGTQILVHKTPGLRRTWAIHGVDCCYVGAAPEHYPYYRVYIPFTAAKCITKTVNFFPHSFSMLQMSSANDSQRAAHDFIDALANPSLVAPFATLGQYQLRVIRQLATIFNSAAGPWSPTAVPLVSQAPHAPYPRVCLSPVQYAPSARLRPAAATQTPASSPRVAPPHLIPATAEPAPHRRTPLQSHSHAILSDVASAPRVDPPHLIPTTAEPMPYQRTPLWYHTHAIPSDANDPSAPRYPLCSRTNCNKANSVIYTETGQALKYHHLNRGPNKAVWIRSYANELGRLPQGVGTRMPTSTNPVYFVALSAVSCGRKVTYGRLVATLLPHKEEVHLVRITAGGDKLNYPSFTATHCASLTTTKCLINSTLSNTRSKFLVLNI